MTRLLDKLLYVTALQVLAIAAYAQDNPPAPEPPKPVPEETLRLEAPKQAQPARQVKVTLKGAKTEANTGILWDVLCGDRILEKEGANAQLIDLGQLLYLTGEKSDKPYRVRCSVFHDGKWRFAEASIIIGDKLPDPPKPDPIDPDVPDPPAPAKIALLYMHEESNADPRDLAIIKSKEVEDYLRAHCQLEADGRPAYRVWDDDYTDEQIASHGKMWVEAYHQAKEHRTSVGQGDNAKWLLITNGKDGESVPTPKTDKEFMELLRKWGGQ